MKRRKAIIQILLLGGTGVALTYLYKTYKLFKTPDFDILAENRELINELTETIIPKTDTPGAKEVGAGDFVIRLVRNCTGKQTQNKFVNGLQELSAYTQTKYHKDFGKCSMTERTEILNYFESQLSDSTGLMEKVESRLLGDPFIVTLKKYTVMGYCTSEPGATLALSYDFTPGQYQGVIEMSSGQKAWALY